MLSVIYAECQNKHFILSVIKLSAECHYAEGRYAECRGANSHTESLSCMDPQKQDY